MRFPVLVSYAYLRRERDDVIEALLGDDRFEMLLDSGAFTAKNAGESIELDDYISFCHRWRSRLFGYISLDVIQNPAASDSNFRAMLASGLSPVPVHVLGDDERKMDELFERSDWVALGGLRRPHRGAADSSYISAKMRWAKGRKVHWLGYTTARMISAHRPFSCDCSSHSYGVRYGYAAWYHGAGRISHLTYPEFVRLALSKPTETEARLARYGLSLSDALNRSNWSSSTKTVSGPLEAKSFLLTLPTLSWVDYILDIRRRYGTRVFMALSVGRQAHFRSVAQAVELLKSEPLSAREA